MANDKFVTSSPHITVNISTDPKTLTIPDRKEFIKGLAIFLDKTDGKTDNKISASIWNSEVAKVLGTTKIKNYITTENAEKVLSDKWDILCKHWAESKKGR